MMTTELAVAGYQDMGDGTYVAERADGAMAEVLQIRGVWAYLVYHRGGAIAGRVNYDWSSPADVAAALARDFRP